MAYLCYPRLQMGDSIEDNEPEIKFEQPAEWKYKKFFQFNSVFSMNGQIKIGGYIMVDFADASVNDLSRATQFLHYVNPKLRNKIVYAIEKAQPMDQCVVFHLMERKLPEGEKRTDEHKSIFMLSAEYILEHSYWKTLGNV